MSEQNRMASPLDRRGFFKTAGAGFGAAGLMLTHRDDAERARRSPRGPRRPSWHASPPARSRFATSSRPGLVAGARAAPASPPPPTPATAAGARQVVRRRPPAAPSGQPCRCGGRAGQGNGGMTNAQMKEKYGEITMLDFPQFTKDTFPGVTHMDLFSGLFGDVTDDTMFAGSPVQSVEPVGKEVARATRGQHGEDRHQVQHISNNAPINLAGPRRRPAQGGCRDGQAMARGLRGPRREVDADELHVGARSEHQAAGDSARSRRRISQEPRHRSLAEGGHRVV